MTGLLEAQVQNRVMAYLKLRNDIFWARANTGGAMYDDFFVQFGVRGAADIQGLQAPGGRFFGLECKREKGGVVTEEQKRWGQNVINHGGIWAVVRSIEDAAAALGPVKAHVVKLRPVKLYPSGS